MKKSRISTIKRSFYLLIMFFLLIVLFFLVSAFYDVGRQLFLVAGLIALIWLINGFVLIYLVLKSKIKGKLKWYLLMCGGSAGSFLISAILHNVFYGFAVLSKDIAILHWFFEFLDGLFFLLGIIGVPVLFFIGVIGGIWCLRSVKNL